MTYSFLHAKCYLFYSGAGFERFTPVAAIAGSSNFTRPGLLTNKELNLVHRANLTPAEVSPEQVKGFLESPDRKRLAALDNLERVTAANLPGVLAISELSEWYERQWEGARDFKEQLIDLLDASKFGRKAYEAFTTNPSINELLTTIQSISQEKDKSTITISENKTSVCREDLKLICFDYLWQ